MKQIYKFFLVVGLVLFDSPITLAGAGEHIRKLANEYNTKKMLSEVKKTAFSGDLTLLPPSRCEPTQPSRASCFDTVCDKLGTFQCNEQSEIQRVGRICASQFDGGCIEKVCARLGSFECNQFQEIEQVAHSCRDVIGSSCLDEVCDRLGSFNCNEQQEIAVVGEMCRGRVDGACVKSVCDRLGSSQCNEVSELKVVLDSCRGL